MAPRSQTIRRRRWQKDALDAFAARTRDDFVAVGTPETGKTIFALAAARQDLSAQPDRLWDTSCAAFPERGTDESRHTGVRLQHVGHVTEQSDATLGEQH